MRRFRLIRRVTAAAALALGALAVWPLVLEAILVAPHAVFMDHRSRTGQVFLVNTSDTPEEVSIDLTYGYPATDSSGTIYIKLVDQPDSSEPSAAGWVKAYPRRAVLAPGQRQVVRLLATPPADLADGEYWSRIIATSRGSKVAVVSGESGVSAGLALELRTIISLSYRKGEVHTGLDLTDLRAAQEGDSLVVWLRADRRGNAAFLGTLTGQLVDAGNHVRGEWESPLAVYHSLNRRYVFPIDSAAPGHYSFRLGVTTTRSDLDQHHILPAEPVSRTVDLEIR
ncbi:MAG TPA: hypothetical protein VHR41_16955 [Gemmatimonadales bacterium]|jgi:hypothetical protein|nr:hypothetical protein [Gemmatimonadales bacterium]